MTGNTPLGLHIAYQPPDAVGADRLVDALAAVHKYGAPCIVIDFGTATTFNAIAGGPPSGIGSNCRSIWAARSAWASAFRWRRCLRGPRRSRLSRSPSRRTPSATTRHTLCSRASCSAMSPWSTAWSPVSARRWAWTPAPSSRPAAIRVDRGRNSVHHRGRAAADAGRPAAGV